MALVRSALNTEQKQARSTTTEPPEKSNSSLFHCESCDTVYIAIEKSSCSTCRTTVEQVPSKFDNL